MRDIAFDVVFIFRQEVVSINNFNNNITSQKHANQLYNHQILIIYNFILITQHLMSLSSNNGPIKPIPNSQSRHSLYTSHSNDSDDNNNILNNHVQKSQKPQKQQKQTIQQPQQNISIKQHITSQLPKIKPHNNVQLNQQSNKKKLPIQHQQMLPKPYQFQRKSFQLQAKINSMPQTQHLRRYHNDDQQSNMSVQEHAQQRMLRSSQGGRWLRSKSIMNQKQQKSPQYLLRHFHRHGSVMIQAINKYLNYFVRGQQQITKKNYRLSLYEPLQISKSKMESYLEKKVKLENVSIDKPGVDWSQQQLTKFYTKYQPILSETLSDLTSRTGITLKKYKNCVYFGHMVGGKKHGLGVLHYFNGKLFEGYFEDDYKIQGLEMDESQLYLGHFKKGLKSGQGILKTDQYLYCGTFTDGEFGLEKPRQQVTKSILGLGPIVGSSTVYNIPNKKGFKIQYSLLTMYDNNIIITKNSNGDIFIGTLNEKQQKNGEGLQIFANGDLYIGKYQAGSPEGYGQYYWDSGANYRGLFLSGMRHGKGKWQMVQGDTYQGQYMNDKKNGKGTYIWKSGIKYIGQFQNDYRHGYGQMYWQDGRVYKGQWINGIESNKTIKLQHPIKQPAKQISSLHKNAFRTVQHSSLNKRKIPLDKLKSIYNPSNNIN